MDKLYSEHKDSGMVETMYAEDDGTLHVKYEHDAEPAFETILKARNQGEIWQRGMKTPDKMVHAYHIPVGVVMELYGIGVNVYTADMKEIVAGLHRINRHDACKLTDKRVI